MTILRPVAALTLCTLLADPLSARVPERSEQPPPPPWELIHEIEQGVSLEQNLRRYHAHAANDYVSVNGYAVIVMRIRENGYLLRQYPIIDGQRATNRGIDIPFSIRDDTPTVDRLTAWYRSDDDEHTINKSQDIKACVFAPILSPKKCPDEFLSVGLTQRLAMIYVLHRKSLEKTADHHPALPSMIAKQIEEVRYAQDFVYSLALRRMPKKLFPKVAPTLPGNM